MTSTRNKSEKWLQAALGQHRAGNLKRAIDYYRRYLRDNPDNAGVLHTVGGLYFQLQNFDKAGEFLEKAYRSDPGNPGYLNDLGAYCMQVKDYAGAVEMLSKLVAGSPGNADASYNLGLAYYGACRFPEAINAFEQAIILRPDYAAAYYNKGIAFLEMGQFPNAVESLRKAVMYAPALAVAHQKLGEVLLNMREYDSAIASLYKARELDGNNVKTVTTLAMALQGNGQIGPAIDLLQDEYEKHPDSISIISALGSLFGITGDIDKAEEFYEKALSKDRDNSALHFSYAHIREFSSKDRDEIDQVQSLLGNENLADEDRKNLCFALGKIYDDCGEYDKAFENYQVANSIIKKSVNYHYADRQQLVKDTISVFTRELFSGFEGIGTKEERPVFIVGMPRSGTTLVEQVLSAHPDVTGGGELVYFANIHHALSGMLGVEDPYPSCCKLLDGKTAGTLVRQYLQLLSGHSDTTRFVTDKMPGNYLYLGLIRVLFPDAPIIHCCRNPLDVCLSCYFQSFKNTMTYAFDLMDTGHHYLEYERLMSHWRKVLPGPLLEIRYEDLVTEPEKTSRDLVQFCGLEWHDNCLRYHEQKREIRTESYRQARQPIYTSSVERWKNYEKYLQPLMQLFAQARDEL